MVTKEKRLIEAAFPVKEASLDSVHEKKVAARTYLYAERLAATGGDVRPRLDGAEDEMRLAPPRLEIGDRDGFDGTDIFCYEKFGRNLASLVESLEGSSVVALDGGWGSGKTVFAKQWAGLLRNCGSAVIYFDAFAADSGDDPLFDIASQLFAAAKEGRVRKDFGEKAVAVFKVLAMRVPAAALRLTVGGGLGEEIVGTLADAQEAGTSDGGDVSAAFHRPLGEISGSGCGAGYVPSKPHRPCSRNAREGAPGSGRCPRGRRRLVQL